MVHIPGDRPSLLVNVFVHRCAAPICEVESHAPLVAGTIFFAPADYHVLTERDRTLALSLEGPDRWSRPSIDVLFASAADAAGDNAVGVLLTGAGALAALDHVDSLCAAAVASQRDRLVDHRQPRSRDHGQPVDARLQREVARRELAQRGELALEHRPGARQGREECVVAGEQIAALAGLGLEHGDAELPVDGNDLQRVLDPALAVGDRLLPCHIAPNPVATTTGGCVQAAVL